MKIKLLVITAVLAPAALAAAETADAALQRGHDLYKVGRIHEACEAYAASDRLAASAATERELASCYEQDARPVAAARLYKHLGDPAKATKLEANAPKLRFAINPTPGLVVKVDGLEVPATEDVPVDVGPHEVVATAPGFAGHTSVPVDRDRIVVDVIVRMQPVAETAAPNPSPSPSPTPTPTPNAGPTPVAATAMTPEPAPAASHRKTYGIAAAAVGAAAIVTSAVMYGLAEHKFNDEHALCPSSRCANDGDLATANSLLSDARTYRNIGIGTSIGGGLLLIAGGYLLFAPHAETTHVSVQVGRDGAGMAYTGSF